MEDDFQILVQVLVVHLEDAGKVLSMEVWGNADRLDVAAEKGVLRGALGIMRRLYHEVVVEIAHHA